ncbi:MAG: DUF4405 domain-containing protein [Sarcina sp.]|nr:DUF4405 domain-containing protein [Sarcina sp.]
MSWMHDSKNKIRRIVDVGMTVLLLFLMAYQVTGETAHEWIGMAMTLLVIIHQVLNRRWYGAVFKGKYTPYRALTTILNVLLLAAFALTAICGMAMSGHAVPFLYGMLPVSFARTMHLSMSHWAFVLMGLHLGMHVPVMIAGMKLSSRAKTAAGIALTFAAGIGLYLFLRNRMPDYLFFRSVFAFLDYEKAAWRVLGGNILMLLFWAFEGAQAALFCRSLSQRKVMQRAQRKDLQAASPLVPVIYLMAAVLLGLILHMGLSGQETGAFGSAGFSGQLGRRT